MIGRIRGLLRDAAVAARVSDAAVEVPSGDDAAAIHLGAGRRLLATTDAFVEGVHFDPAIEQPQDVGYRSIVANVSDICAMGGVPRWGLVSLVLPPATEAGWVERLVGGMAEAAGAARAMIVGGNLARGGQMVISVTMLGETRVAPLRRDGARPGDGLYLTGPVGAAAAARLVGAEAVSGVEGEVLRRRRDRPPMRIDAAVALATVAGAAIDVSDGLFQDLRHLLEASGVSARIDLAALPLAFGHPRTASGPRVDLALGGGDDYEIVVAVPQASVRLADRLLADAGIGLYRFGVIEGDGPVGRIVATGSSGRDVVIDGGGWRHFPRCAGDGRSSERLQGGGGGVHGRSGAPRPPCQAPRTLPVGSSGPSDPPLRPPLRGA